MIQRQPRLEVIDGVTYELSIFGGDGRAYDGMRAAEGETTSLPERRGSLLYKRVGSVVPEISAHRTEVEALLPPQALNLTANVSEPKGVYFAE